MRAVELRATPARSAEPNFEYSIHPRPIPLHYKTIYSYRSSLEQEEWNWKLQEKHLID